jgi:hypothetical protein
VQGQQSQGLVKRSDRVSGEGRKLRLLLRGRRDGFCEVASMLP